MAQSSPRSTWWWWSGSGWRRKRRNWSGCLRLRPSFYFRVASATTYPSQYVMPYRAQSFFLFTRRSFHSKNYNFPATRIFKWVETNRIYSHRRWMGTAEECRMVTSFACKENWVERERERISAGFYEWHSCRGSKKVWPAAGEKKIDKKGYSFFPKLTKSKLFFVFFLNEWSALIWFDLAPSHTTHGLSLFTSQF